MKPIINSPLTFGQNTRIDIQSDLDGGVMLVIREGMDKPRTYRVSRESGIGIGLACLKAAGVPIDEAINRQNALQQGRAPIG